MDSILSVRLAKELGDWAGCKVEDAAAWSFPTAEAMAEHIVSRNRARLEDDHHEIGGLSDEVTEALLLAELEKVNR